MLRLNNQKDINPFALAKRIGRPLILDGAMGSLLQSRHIKIHSSLWMSHANVEFPDQVLNIHKQYIEAGADIITTNTFRTNPSAVNHTPKLTSKELVKTALNIAAEAAADLPVFIAGSNAPAEDCYQISRTLTQKELEFNHKTHIDLLINHGSHFILNETQSHFDEIKIICRHCSENSIPYVLSLFFNADLSLLSGENLDKTITYILDHGPLAVGFNCIMPSMFKKFIKTFNNNAEWGYYLNCGDGSYTDENIKCGIDPKEYGKHVKRTLPLSPSFIGSCCGSTPEHISEIKRIIDAKTFH